MPKKGGDGLGPVCVVHFQGNSKRHIPEFKNFLEGKRPDFVLP